MLNGLHRAHGKGVLPVTHTLHAGLQHATQSFGGISLGCPLQRSGQGCHMLSHLIDGRLGNNPFVLDLNVERAGLPRLKFNGFVDIIRLTGHIITHIETGGVNHIRRSGEFRQEFLYFGRLFFRFGRINHADLQY